MPVAKQAGEGSASAKKAKGPTKLSEYAIFRQKYIAQHLRALRAKNSKEITTIVKAAWRKKTGKLVGHGTKRKDNGKPATAYMKFRTIYLKKHSKRLCKMTLKEITAEVKIAYKRQSPYLVFRTKYINDHADELKGLKEKEITVKVKGAWKELKKQEKEKAKAKKKAAKEKARGRKKKTKAKKAKKKKTRKEIRLAKKREELTKKLKALAANPDTVNESAVKSSPYILFRTGYIALHKKDFKGLSKREKTLKVKTAWTLHKEGQKAAAKGKSPAKSPAKDGEGEGEKGAKGPSSAYQIFRSAFLVAQGIPPTVKVSKDITSLIKAAWQKKKGEMKAAKKLKKKVRKKRPKKKKARLTVKKQNFGMTNYMLFRIAYSMIKEEEFSNMSEKEVTGKVKVAWDSQKLQIAQDQKAERKRKREPSETTPYQAFRTEYIRAAADEIKGKSRKDVTKMVKDAWKQNKSAVDAASSPAPAPAAKRAKTAGRRRKTRAI